MCKHLARRSYRHWLMVTVTTCLLVSNAQAQSIELLQNSVGSSVSAGAFDPLTNSPDQTSDSDNDGLANASPTLSVSSYALASQGRASAYGGASASSSVSVNPQSSRMLGGQISLSTLSYKQSKSYDPKTGDFYNAWVSGSSSASLSFLNQSQMSDVLRLRWAFEGGGAVAVEGPGFLAGGPSGSYEGGLDSFYPTFNLYLTLQGTGDSSASASLTWSINESLPGLSRETALEQADDVLYVEEGVELATDVTGAWFTVPSAADYGMDESVYFNTVITDEEITPGAGPTYRAGDALFASDVVAFTTIVMPTAVPDSGWYTLEYGENQVQLAAGETFDFRNLQAEGTHAFRILGLGDEVVLGNANSLPSYATGLTFGAEGLARFRFQLLSSLGLPGDFNGDDVVDLADYTVWRDNLGAPSTALRNDIDGGEVGMAQYLRWRSNFGRTASSPLLATGSSVPEPQSMQVLVAGLLTLLLGCRCGIACDASAKT